MRKILFGALFTGMFLFLVTPLASFANTATMDSITPPILTISEGGEEPSPGVFLEVYNAQFGQTYTAVYSVDREPAYIVTTGAQVNSWSYNDATHKVTVNCTHTGFVQGAGDFGPTNPFGIAIVWPENNEFDGPPAEMIGGWMSTNLIQWNLIPPDEETGKSFFGFELAGPAGEQAYFSMFVPDNTLDYLAQIKGSPLDFNDMALFINGGQANVSYEEVDGGAELFIEVTFKANTTQVAAAGSSIASTVSKKITYRKKKRLSAVATKAKVKKGGTSKLKGWLTTKKVKNRKYQPIVLKRKLKNGKFEKWKVVKTNKRGYYYKKFKVNKTATYRALWNKTKKTKWKSDKIKVSKK